MLSNQPDEDELPADAPSGARPGLWVDERSSGPRPTLRRGSHRDTPPFDGLYLNERRRAYFTLRPVKGNVKWPRGRPPDSNLWVVPFAAVHPLHQQGERVNCTPKDGLEREAVWQFLCP